MKARVFKCYRCERYVIQTNIMCQRCGTLMGLASERECQRELKRTFERLSQFQEAIDETVKAQGERK